MTRLPSRILSHGVIWLWIGFAALPFVWMILASLRDPSDLIDPASLLFSNRFAASENYGRVLEETPLLRFMVNGFIVCGVILLVQIVTAMPCAYAMAKLRFSGKSWLMALIILGLLIPFQATALPIFVGLAWMKTLNSYFALVAPYLVSPFAILLFSQFLRAFPDEILEAARIDRCSQLTILWRIILPASWPVVAAFSVFSISAHWNDLYWPLIAISSADLAPPTLGILIFRGSDGGDWVGAMMAAASIITLPLAVVFLIAQRRFVQGLTMGGTK